MIPASIEERCLNDSTEASRIIIPHVPLTMDVHNMIPPYHGSRGGPSVLTLLEGTTSSSELVETQGGYPATEHKTLYEPISIGR